MSRLIEIRKEFGEPFVDVVRGFAEMGYSRTATAATLEINLSYFRQLLVRFNLQSCFLPQPKMRRDCRGGNRGKGGWPKGKKRGFAPKHSDEQILAEVGKYNHLYQFMSLADISYATVCRRLGGWKKARALVKEGKC